MCLMTAETMQATYRGFLQHCASVVTVKDCPNRTSEEMVKTMSFVERNGFVFG